MGDGLHGSGRLLIIDITKVTWESMTAWAWCLVSNLKSGSLTDTEAWGEDGVEPG